MIYKILREHLFPYLPEKIVVNYGHYGMWFFSLFNKSRSKNNSTRLAGMKIHSPVGLASGWADSVKKMKLAWLLGAGFVTSKTITLRPRKGNPYPRLVRGKNGLINSMGLPNPGLKAWVKELEKQQPKFPFIQSITGSSLREYETLVNELEPFVKVFELNFSCPNTEKGLPDIDSSIQLIKEISSITTKPILVKLSPANTPKGNLKIIKGVHGTIAGVTLINTVPVKHERLGNPWKKGGLSGNIVYPILLEHLNLVRQYYHEEDLEIVATGGIDTPQKVRELREKYKAKIGVLTAFLYHGPSIFKSLNASYSKQAHKSSVGMALQPKSSASKPSALTTH